MMHVLDTNIVIQHLAGQLVQELPDGSYALSVISELELLSWPGIDSEGEKRIAMFIDRVSLVTITPEVRDTVIRVRRSNKLPLPDAIVVATAIALGAPLMTNDTRLKKLVIPGLAVVASPMRNGSAH